MRVSRTALALVLKNHVAEIRFLRRNQKLGYNRQRRMLCTNDTLLLMSAQGRSILNYTAPTGQLKYNPASKNLLIVWDVFYQNFRAVNCNDCDLVAVIKSTPPDDFWKYFSEKIAPMSSGEKAQFMNN
jgi:hypothetical protein